MGMGDGSLGRAVFQGSLGGVFRDSCRARRRSARRSAPSAHRSSDSLLLSECTPVLPLSPPPSPHPVFLSPPLYTFSLAPLTSLVGYSTYGRTRRTSPPSHGEKGLGNRLRDSLPSLNERETLHTACTAQADSLVVILSADSGVPRIPRFPPM